MSCSWNPGPDHRARRGRRNEPEQILLDIAPTRVGAIVDGTVLGMDPSRRLMRVKLGTANSVEGARLPQAQKLRAAIVGSGSHRGHARAAASERGRNILTGRKSRVTSDDADSD